MSKLMRKFLQNNIKEIRKEEEQKMSLKNVEEKKLFCKT